MKTATRKFATVKEYLASLPTDMRSRAQELRDNIKQVIPDADETISYNMPCFSQNGKGVIWFAVWKEHISIYPRTATLEKAIPALAQYDGAKGTMRFPADKPLPLALVRRIAKFRARETMAKASK